MLLALVAQWACTATALFAGTVEKRRLPEQLKEYLALRRENLLRPATLCMAGRYWRGSSCCGCCGKYRPPHAVVVGETSIHRDEYRRPNHRRFASTDDHRKR